MTIHDTLISRRSVLAGFGGLTFCAAIGGETLRLVTPAQGATIADAHVTPWVRIAPDGTVTILSAGAEMGQGSMTGLPLIVAEEMDADWSKVRIEMAPADKAIYGYTLNNERMMQIVGSRATQLYFNDLRLAGAQVRRVLIANAAQKWGVDAATLKTEPGAVVNPATGAKLTYGEIAAFGTIPDPLPKVEMKDLKARKDYRLIGHAQPRRDIPGKVNGTAQYAMDVKLPGMVYATVLHAPVAGSEPQSWNDAEIKKMPGVIATQKLPGAVGVVATHFEQAMAARNALKVEWSQSKVGCFDSEKVLEAGYVKLADDPNTPTTVLDQKGDVSAAFAKAAKTYKAEFRNDYAYHAQMEPLNAVVRIDGDKVDLWEGTQGPDASRAAVAKALGVPEAQVNVHQCYMGGGFGRRSLGDYASECALLAKAVAKPVKLVWMREDDLAHGRFRPQSFQRLEAAVDDKGVVSGWRHTVVGDGAFLLHTGIKIPYYEVPNQHIERRGVAHGVQIFFWRAVGHVANIYAIEGMVERMAADAGMDPIEFRLTRMAPTPKARRVFEKVAQMSDWKTPRPAGRALGVSISERSNSLGAGVVEISLDKASGKIRVHKVWLAVDGGIIVQPDAAKANTESAIVYGLSGALHERVTLKDGAVEQSNFHDYNVMRMSDLPEEMHIEFVDVDTRPTGLGELGTPFIGAAIANAFHTLTGKWLDHLPFTPERVQATLKA